MQIQINIRKRLGVLKSNTALFGVLAIFALLFISQHGVDAQLLANPQTNGLLPLPTPVLDAKDDTVQTNEDTSKAINVMSNDVFIGLLVNPSVSSVTQPSHGQAIKNGNTVTYVPNSNFFGTDSFRYTLSNGLLTDTATVFVTVSSVNDSPSATNDLATTNEDTMATISVLANDSDVDGNILEVSSATQGSSGSTSITSNTIRYTPHVNFNGEDSFSYTIQDGNGGSASATVLITINAVNDNPDATDDSFVTNEDESATVGVLANDSDPDGHALVINSVTQGSNGQTTINADHTITYTPNADFSGSDVFAYTVSDGHGGQDTSNVSITISPIADLVIDKIQSGLVSSDPLNNETQTRQELEAEQGFWHYNGSAFVYFSPPAPTDLYKDSEGLHVGVQTPANGTYAGYYAVTQPTNAKLFHSVISTPVRTISGDFFQNGLYVQTWDGRINYVTCVSITSTAGTSWHIIRTFGNEIQATQFEVLWSDGTANQPLTRDCTIITNGVNYLKVYLDGIKVYENNSIDLQMPGPFLYFLEPQNSHAEMLYGVYRDYYSAIDETIKVTNIPVEASRVDVVSSSGNVLAISAVTNGVATLDIGMYHFPLDANIVVYDSNNNELVSKSASIFGGDEYAVISQ